jgi:DNA-directed RNA polymerase specialized sigma24 family protein
MIVYVTEALFRCRSKPMVYRTACVITRSPEDAENVVQAIFVRLRSKGIQTNLKNPETYLYKATVRT